MLTQLLRDQTATGDKGISKQHLFSHLKQTLNKHLACCTLQKSAGTLQKGWESSFSPNQSATERKGKLDEHNEKSNSNSSNNEPSNSNRQIDSETANDLIAKVA